MGCSTSFMTSPALGRARQLLDSNETVRSSACGKARCKRRGRGAAQVSETFKIHDSKGSGTPVEIKISAPYCQIPSR